MQKPSSVNETEFAVLKYAKWAEQPEIDERMGAAIKDVHTIVCDCPQFSPCHGEVFLNKARERMRNLSPPGKGAETTQRAMRSEEPAGKEAEPSSRAEASGR